MGVSSSIYRPGCLVVDTKAMFLIFLSAKAADTLPGIDLSYAESVTWNTASKAFAGVEGHYLVVN